MTLPLGMTLMLGVFAMACSTLIVFVHFPLPWAGSEPLALPPLYIGAIWLSNLVAIVFIGAYAWQIAEETRLLADALTATELVLAREQHLSSSTGSPPRLRMSSSRRSPPSRSWRANWSARCRPPRRSPTT